MSGRPATPESLVKAVVFDIGATLVTGPPVAPNKVIAKLLNERKCRGSGSNSTCICRQRGEVSASEVASVIMTQPFESAQEVYAALESRFGALDEGVLGGIASLWNAQLNAAREIDGASETVCRLKDRGIKIGLLSDIWSPYYTSVEAAIPQVIACADYIVLSFRTGRRKPEPANFLLALDRLGVKPEEAVMIGDTYEHDILPGIKLGMKTAWVLARPDRESESIRMIEEGKWPAPTWIVHNISEVGLLNFQIPTLDSERQQNGNRTDRTSLRR